jgi:hypothetical protein
MTTASTSDRARAVGLATFEAPEALHVVDDGDWPSIPTVCKHFGTLSRAVAEAGLGPRLRGQRAAGGRRADRPSADAADGSEAVLAMRIRPVANARTADDVHLLAASLQELPVAAPVGAQPGRTHMARR